MKKLERVSALVQSGVDSLTTHTSMCHAAGVTGLEERMLRMEDLLDESKMECAVDCFTHDGCYCNCGADEWNKRVDECLGS